MKKPLCIFIITVLFIGICGCKSAVPEASSSRESTAVSKALSVGESTSVHDSSTTGAAKQLGITSENYPVIDGSTSTFSIVHNIYNAMFIENGGPADKYPAKASKTVPSYNLLIDGKADMVIVPYASADILNQAKAKGVTLEFNRIAKEALIFITSIENPAENITAEQVRNIYLDNAIDNWKEIGGPDKKLVPICRNADSGSQSQMDNLILNHEKMHPDIIKNYVELTMEDMLYLVAFYHGGGIDNPPTESYALGYTLYTYLQTDNNITGIGDHLKILAFDGITPNQESLATGEYSLTDGYYAVIRSDLPEDHPARAIIDWLHGDGVFTIANLGLIASN